MQAPLENILLEWLLQKYEFRKLGNEWLSDQIHCHMIAPNCERVTRFTLTLPWSESLHTVPASHEAPGLCLPHTP